MKRLSWLSVLLVFTILVGCTKEYSLENGGGSNNGSDQIVGVDCRIMKMSYYDSATNIAMGSLAASFFPPAVNDTVKDITLFDSVNNVIAFSTPQFVYGNDTVYLNSDEYFIRDVTTNNVVKARGIFSSAFPPIPFEIDYIYNSDGTLFQKRYNISGAPVNPAVVVEYTYSAGNLIKMVSTDYTTVTPELIMDAELDYYANIKPRGYLNLMPDETLSNDLNHFAPYTQFFNFGSKPLNALRYMKVRNYDPGNVVRDSSVSTFAGYITSRDNYVLSVYMLGDDQESIPAAAGRINFSYHCKQ